MSKLWYRQYEELFIEMNSYILSLKKESKRLEDFFQEYDKETASKFIFESNTIEKEGLNEGETKKLYLDIIDEINNKNVEIKQTEIKKENKILEVVKCDVIYTENDVKFEYNGKKKEYITTCNQILTLLISRNKMMEKKVEEKKSHILYLKTKGVRKNKIKEILHPKTYLSEKYLKEMHFLLSRGLKNNDNGNPGEYRIDGAYIDENTIFMGKEFIEKAIEVMLEKHEKRLKNKNFDYILEGIVTAAAIVNIHPFGDFNGRLSRIVLNTFFRIDDIPFYLVLRSNKKDREKYILSMKHYYKHRNIETFIALVSKAFLNQINDINYRLMDLGMKTIKPKKLKPKEINEIKNKLNYYFQKK